MNVVPILIAMLYGFSAVSGMQAKEIATPPTQISVKSLTESTSELNWFGPVGTYYVRATKFSSHGRLMQKTVRSCQTNLVFTGAGSCAVKRLSPGKWRVTVRVITKKSQISGTKIVIVPILEHFPTTFAPCAGTAATVFDAAIACVSDWAPSPQKLMTVVYHFAPGVPNSVREEAKAVVGHTLDRSTAFVGMYVGRIKPTLHIVITDNDWKYCESVARSLGKRASLEWMWDKTRRDGCNFPGGGQGLGTNLENTTSAWWYEDWDEQDATQQTKSMALFASEVGHAIQNNIGQRYGDWASFLSLNQAWLGYTWPWVNAFSYTVNNWTRDQVNDYWADWALEKRLATWQPTFADERWCPQPGTRFALSCGTYVINDVGGINREYPNNYHLIAQMVPYIIAYFGPSWIQDSFWPVFFAEYRGSDSSFRPTYDRIARRLWGGKWSDLERALTEYVVTELRQGGVEGLQ